VAGAEARPTIEIQVRLRSFSGSGLRKSQCCRILLRGQETQAQAGKPVPPVLKIIINDLTKCCFFPNFFKMDLKQKTENRKQKTGN
jgi:hypothetical protein